MTLLDKHPSKWIPEPNTGCLIWIGALNSKFSPSVKVGGRAKRVTRIVCEETNGPPPTPAHQAAHNTPNGCIGSICVNGGHLRWATNRENQLDTPLERRVASARLAWVGLSPDERSKKAKRGYANTSVEVQKERARLGGLARWSK
jgi:hypothetical protein